MWGLECAELSGMRKGPLVLRQQNSIALAKKACTTGWEALDIQE
jgi:hypothetical protein